MEFRNCFPPQTLVPAHKQLLQRRSLLRAPRLILPLLIISCALGPSLRRIADKVARRYTCVSVAPYTFLLWHFLSSYFSSTSPRMSSSISSSSLSYMCVCIYILAKHIPFVVSPKPLVTPETVSPSPLPAPETTFPVVSVTPATPLPRVVPAAPSVLPGGCCQRTVRLHFMHLASRDVAGDCSHVVALGQLRIGGRRRGIKC